MLAWFQKLSKTEQLLADLFVSRHFRLAPRSAGGIRLTIAPAPSTGANLLDTLSQSVKNTLNGEKSLTKDFPRTGDDQGLPEPV